MTKDQHFQLSGLQQLIVQMFPTCSLSYKFLLVPDSYTDDEGEQVNCMSWLFCGLKFSYDTRPSEWIAKPARFECEHDVTEHAIKEVDKLSLRLLSEQIAGDHSSGI